MIAPEPIACPLSDFDILPDCRATPHDDIGLEDCRRVNRRVAELDVARDDEPVGGRRVGVLRMAGYQGRTTGRRPIGEGGDDIARPRLRLAQSGCERAVGAEN